MFAADVALAPHVDPAAQRTEIVLWSAFNLLACAGFLAMFVARLCVPRRRKNLVLLNLEFAFFFATGGSASLTWTGHVMDRDVPFGLCLASGAFMSSISTIQTGAAFALTCKAWAHGMRLNHPRSRLFLTLSSTSLLVPLPWLAAVPTFFAALGIGLADRSSISRGSSFYCLNTNSSLTNATLVIDIIFEVGSLGLAAWTASLVARTHWRARAMQSHHDGGLSYYPLIVRTLIFSALLMIAFASNIASAFIGYAAPVPDLITSALGLAAVFVFGTEPTLMRTVMRWRRSTPSTTTGTVSFAFAPASAVREADAEEGVYELRSERKPPRASEGALAPFEPIKIGVGRREEASVSEDEGATKLAPSERL